jgi:hypothetical protein
LTAAESHQSEKHFPSPKAARKLLFWPIRSTQKVDQPHLTLAAGPQPTGHPFWRSPCDLIHFPFTQ